MNIKVAIRVRPFNQREIDLNTELCVKMNGQSIMLLNEKSEIDRTFSYDYCFWSHDGFKTLSDGYNEPASASSPYADQHKVYELMGRELLGNALQGYNCCLFAYGQTGSGKSYSIFGYGANKGIVPIICDEILNGKTLVNTEKNSFQLMISMLEIYNEKIQDLLIPINKRPKGGLTVREHPRVGVYVEDLTKYTVKNYKEIEEIINNGNKNKTLGATLMNATSSRAHTIITLELIQRETGAIKTTEKISVVNLVDLAGSEKVAKTDAQGDRLKEACSINKSLTCLGIVIHQLYLKSEGQKTVISYRDSALTRILQNALGGNSKTTMICAVSPARDNYEETLSTLRYADQAKKIKLEAKINESETDKLIRELTEENDKLKKLLAEFKAGKTDVKIDSVEQNINDIQEEIQLRKGATFVARELEEDLHPSCANVINLNEDPLLSGKICYSFDKVNRLIIGRNAEVEDSAQEKRIIINSVGVQQEHALIEKVGSDLFIEALSPYAATNLFVNGETILENEGKFRVKLSHCDRVVIGSSSTFVVRIPTGGQPSPQNLFLGDTLIDWEFCQLEKFQRQDKEKNEVIQQRNEAKKKELQANEERLRKEFEDEKKHLQEQLQKQREEFELAITTLEDRTKDLENESFIRQKEEANDQNEDFIKQVEAEIRNRELEFTYKLESIKKESEAVKHSQALNENLEKRLINHYSQINEANSIAEELNRNIEFIPFVSSLEVMDLMGKSASADSLITIKVINHEDGWVNYWSIEKFESRLQLMREAVDHFFMYNVVPYKSDNDPFWDPSEFLPLGQAIILGRNILYRFEMESKVAVIGVEGDIGFAKVKIIPVDEEGKQEDEEEMEELIEKPDDLIEHNLPANFRIEISNMVFFDAFSYMGKVCFFSYQVQNHKGLQTFSTPSFVVKDNEIMFNYSQLISIPQVNFEVIDFYMTKKIVLRLMINEIDEVEKVGKGANPSLKESTPTAIPRRSSINFDKSPVANSTKVSSEKSKGKCEIF